MYKDKFKIYLTPLLIILALSLVLFGCKANGSSSISNASSAVSSEAVSSSGSSDSSSSASSSPSSKSSGSVSAAPADLSSSKAKSGGKEKNSSDKFVFLTIDATKGDDGIVANKVKVEFKSGDTAYSVLKRYCDKKHIIYKAKISSGSVYISSIDGLAEFNRGSASGWLYSINGKFNSQSCNKARVRSGDTVRWVYTTDLGKSEGAPQ